MGDVDLLIEATEHDNVEVVRMILDRNPKVVNERNTSGATALHHAAFNGNRRMAKLLVERGADINIRDIEFGATPAGWALEYLRELGGHLAIELEDLAYAIQTHDNKWVMRFLARFPAMSKSTYKDGITFWQLAAESADPEITKLFEQVAAD